MHRTDAPDFAAGNLFTDGDPGMGVPATVIDDAWLNDIQENVCRLLEALNVTLVKGNYDQLATLLKARVSRAWALIQYNAGTISITAGQNVSGVAVDSTNFLRLTFVNAFADAGSGNAVYGVSVTPNTPATQAASVLHGASSRHKTTTVDISLRNSSANSNVDFSSATGFVFVDVRAV
jgi:hypothetical protein